MYTEDKEVTKYTNEGLQIRPGRAFGRVFISGLLGLLITTLIFCFLLFAVLSLKSLYPPFAQDSVNLYELSDEEIHENYSRMVDYLLQPQPGELTFIKLPMSEDGRIHFADVRALVQGLFKLVLPVLGLALPLAYLLFIKRKDLLALKWSAGFCLLFPLLIGSAMLINFEESFIAFHKLFFRNDYWLFDPVRDPIILYLPSSFFAAMGGLLLILLILAAVLQYVLAHVKGGFRKSRS